MSDNRTDVALPRQQPRTFEATTDPLPVGTWILPEARVPHAETIAEVDEVSDPASARRVARRGRRWPWAVAVVVLAAGAVVAGAAVGSTLAERSASEAAGAAAQRGTDEGATAGAAQGTAHGVAAGTQAGTQQGTQDGTAAGRTAGTTAGASAGAPEGARRGAADGYAQAGWGSYLNSDMAKQ